MHFSLIIYHICVDVAAELCKVFLPFLSDHQHCIRSHQGLTGQPGLFCISQRPLKPAEVGQPPIKLPSWNAFPHRRLTLLSSRLFAGQPSWCFSCPWWTRGSPLCFAAPSFTASSVSSTKTRKARGRLWPRCCPPPSMVSDTGLITMRCLWTVVMRQSAL